MEDYKAKYEKAIEQAKKELQACGSLDCDAARQIFRFFPELVENKDEKIRESLLKYLKESFNLNDEIIYPELANWIAWVEKQTIDISSFPEEQRKYMEKYVNLYKTTLVKLLTERDENVSEILDCENNEIKKIEQKASIDFSDLKTWKYIIDAVLTKEHGIGQYLDNGRTEIMAKELQDRFGNIAKAAWSKEDEKYYDSALWHIKNSCKKEGNVYNWLKSFKERMKGEINH